MIATVILSTDYKYICMKFTLSFSEKAIRPGTLEIVIEEVLWSIRGSYKKYEVSLSQMLNAIL